MRVSYSITGLTELKATLAGFSDRRLNAAVATGLTRTAVEIKNKVKSELPRVFDRPTPYTMKSLYTKPARADRLVAETFFKDDMAGSGTPATKYLLPNVEGGQRNIKRFERALQAAGLLPQGWATAPGPSAKLDAYGNVAKGQIIQVLSQLRITLTSGYTRNMARPTPGNERKVINAIKRAGGRYFVHPVGAKGGKQAGVYLRDVASRSALLVFAFVRPPKYRRRLDFDGMASQVVAARLVPNIDQAIDEAAARLAARPS